LLCLFLWFFDGGPPLIDKHHLKPLVLVIYKLCVIPLRFEWKHVYRADDDRHAGGLALTAIVGAPSRQHGQAFRRFKESLRRTP